MIHWFGAILLANHIRLAVWAELVLKAGGTDRRAIGHLIGARSDEVRATATAILDYRSREFLDGALNALIAEYGPEDGSEPDPDPSGNPSPPRGWFPVVVQGGRE